MKTGDILLLNCGEKFQFKATQGAKLLQFPQPLLAKDTEKVMINTIVHMTIFTVGNY